MEGAENDFWILDFGILGFRYFGNLQMSKLTDYILSEVKILSFCKNAVFIFATNLNLSLYNYMEHSIANLIALISTLMLERSSLGLLVDLLHLVHILGT